MDISGRFDQVDLYLVIRAPLNRNEYTTAIKVFLDVEFTALALITTCGAPRHECLEASSDIQLNNTNW